MEFMPAEEHREVGHLSLGTGQTGKHIYGICLGTQAARHPMEADYRRSRETEGPGRQEIWTGGGSLGLTVRGQCPEKT